MTSASVISNSHSTSDSDRCIHESAERYSGVTLPSPCHEVNPTRRENYSHRPIRTSQSIPLLNRHADLTARIHATRYGIDADSFTDIDVASSINGDGRERQKRIQSTTTTNNPSVSTDIDRPPQATPKSLASRDFSSGATNLSAYSTQSLLRKLLDKAQVLNEYYNDICHQTTTPPHVQAAMSPMRKRSSSTSTNSLLGRVGATPRSLLHRDQSSESIRKSRRKNRSIYDNMSADSSRFNLYADEDNVLKELIRFNNDIDLILSRLEMEGEPVQALPTSQPTERRYSSSTQLLVDDHDRESTESKLDDIRNLLEQTNAYLSDDSGLAASPQINDRYVFIDSRSVLLLSASTKRDVR